MLLLSVVVVVVGVVCHSLAEASVSKLLHLLFEMHHVSSKLVKVKLGKLGGGWDFSAKLSGFLSKGKMPKKRSLWTSFVASEL